MHIAYCTNVRLPNERAHGHQVAHVCDALAELGHNVHIVSPYRHNPIKTDFWTYHEVDPRVQFTIMQSYDGIGNPFLPGVLGLKVTTASYAKRLTAFFLQHSFDLLYTRTPEILDTLLKVGLPVCLELHRIPRRNIDAFIKHCERCTKIVCLTSPMKKELMAIGVPEHKMIVEGDAIAPQRFYLFPKKEIVRGIWDIPQDAFVIGYAGSFVTMGLSKGAEQIVASVAKLREEGRNIHVVLAGGPEREGKQLASTGDFITYCSQLPYKEVLMLYAAADLLIYPAPHTDHPYFMRDTSPLKIFEYMMTKKPMIVADLPPVRDILDADCTFFYQPGDINDLASQIETVIDTPAEAQVKADRAHVMVQNYTWTKRMEHIISSLI